LPEIKWRIQKARRDTWDTIKIVWYILTHNVDLTGGDKILQLPAKIECSSMPESWLVQKKLKKMGVEWGNGATPWSFRHRFWLVIQFATCGLHKGTPYLSWAPQSQFDSIPLPQVDGKAILKEFRAWERTQPAGGQP